MSFHAPLHFLVGYLNGRNACPGKYILEKRLYALAGNMPGACLHSSCHWYPKTRPGSGAPDRAFGVSSLQQIPLHFLKIDANARVLVAVKVQGAFAPSKDHDKVWPYTVMHRVCRSFGAKAVWLSKKTVTILNVWCRKYSGPHFLTLRPRIWGAITGLGALIA